MTEDQRRRLDRLLEPQPTLSLLFPLFVGLFVSTLPTTVAMAMSEVVAPWRWMLQGGFVTVGFVGTVFGWRARRAWRSRP